MKSSKLLFIILSSYLLFGCTKYVEKSSTTNTGSGGTNGGSNNTGSSGTSGTGPIVISYTSTSPCAPSNEVFTFKCSGTGVPTGAIFEWYFGDGNSGSGSTTTNAYQNGGYKTVLVKVKTSSQQDVGSVTIAVKAYGQLVTPIASFGIVPTNQVGTQATYEFQSNSTITTGSATCKWDFGDGGTGDGIKLTHTYQQKPYDQIFNVKLTVYSDAGCYDTLIKQLTVPAAYDINGCFTYTSTSPCLPSKEVFTFTGPTTNVPAGAIYQWDFADGAGTTLGNPVTKSYPYHNTYNVILKIIYNGAIIYSCATPVHPFGIDATPNDSFSVKNTSSTNTTETYFCNNSSNVAGGFSNVQWDWDFGDATTLSTANSTATKIYNRDAAVDKTYTITMKVTANSGCSATKTTTVIIPKQ